MLGRGGHADKRIATTVAFILKCPASTVPQAMRACKFSDEESKHAGMQMAVRRARDKALAGKKRAEDEQLTKNRASKRKEKAKKAKKGNHAAEKKNVKEWDRFQSLIQFWLLIQALSTLNQAFAWVYRKLRIWEFQLDHEQRGNELFCFVLLLFYGYF